MANPNIVNVTTIQGRSVGLTPAVATEVELLANAASSGKIIKINNIIAANIDGTTSIGGTVSLCTNAAAPSSSNTFAIAPNVAIPARASMMCVDKSTSVYLEENMSIRVTAAVASKITFTASYEEIS